VLFYLDESGDLGWRFDRPYRHGGSSRHLTIAALMVAPSLKHQSKRLIKRLYEQFKWDTGKERKWADLWPHERLAFAEKAATLIKRYPGQITYRAITVKKECVDEHIRLDANKLYNYMIKCFLADEMAKHDSVQLLPDPRSIKVESGNSLHDYLQTTLWFEKGAKTILTTSPVDSAKALNIQFADMLAGVVQSHYEDSHSEAWKALAHYMVSDKLFF
jgi:hypothetical protein